MGTEQFDELEGYKRLEQQVLKADEILNDIENSIETLNKSNEIILNSVQKKIDEMNADLTRFEDSNE